MQNFARKFNAFRAWALGLQIQALCSCCNILPKSSPSTKISPARSRGLLAWEYNTVFILAPCLQYMMMYMNRSVWCLVIRQEFSTSFRWRTCTCACVADRMRIHGYVAVSKIVFFRFHFGWSRFPLLTTVSPTVTRLKPPRWPKSNLPGWHCDGLSHVPHDHFLPNLGVGVSKPIQHASKTLGVSARHLVTLPHFSDSCTSRAPLSITVHFSVVGCCRSNSQPYQKTWSISTNWYGMNSIILLYFSTHWFF